MNTKYILMAASLLAVPVVAQETYENAKIVDTDLNGTARYVGMGGAMEALGADISTIATNPAGIGLFRHSTANVSAGLVMQSGLPSGARGDKTNLSFDQVGFVYSSPTGRKSYFNFAFNYHKSKNFDFILNAANNLGGASSSRSTYAKYNNGAFGFPANTDAGTFSQVDGLNSAIAWSKTDTVAYNANSYAFNREHEGYISDYDFNMSGSINERVFLGLTFSLQDVHYKHNGNYTEFANDASFDYTDSRKITGKGFNVKAGVIVRPVAESPFRIGAYVQTPTWYDLETSNYSTVLAKADNGETATGQSSDSYEFKITTPWKFGFSLGHTIGNYLAIGATYEYADYGATKTRINDGYVYDYYPYYGYGDYGVYDYYETSHKDDAMNNHTEETLKGVSTIKLGVEYKPIANLALRAGYNYVSPKYDTSAAKGVNKDGYYISSNGIYEQSASDYTNWKSTNRFTLGVGYQLQKWNFDLAYQYSTQKGEFYPFTADGYRYVDDYTNEVKIDNNIPGYKEVKNNRNQILLTVGYHF